MVEWEEALVGVLVEVVAINLHKLIPVFSRNVWFAIIFSQSLRFSKFCSYDQNAMLKFILLFQL